LQQESNGTPAKFRQKEQLSFVVFYILCCFFFVNCFPVSYFGDAAVSYIVRIMFHIEPSCSRWRFDLVFRMKGLVFLPFFPLSPRVGYRLRNWSLVTGKLWAVYRVFVRILSLTSVSGCFLFYRAWLLASLQVGARVVVTRSGKYGSMVLLIFEVCFEMPVSFVGLIIVSALCAHVSYMVFGKTSFTQAVD